MRRSNAWVMTVAFAASLGGGYVSGRQWRNRPVQSQPTVDSRLAGGTEAALSPTTANLTERARFDLADFEKELRSIRSADRQKRWRRLTDLAASVPIVNARAALAKAREILSKQDWSTFRSVLISRWAEEDAQSVLAYGATLKDRNEHRETVSEALTEWARKDANAAMNWVDKTPPGPDHRAFLIAAFQGLVESSPEQALARLKDLPADERLGMRNQIISALAERDPKAAMDHVLQDAKDRGWGPQRSGVDAVLQIWMEKDPGAAAAWIVAQPEDLRRRSDIVGAIQNYGAGNPGEGVKLAALLPPGKTRDTMLQSILTAWSGQDLDALKAWVASRSDPAEKAMGEIAYAQGLANTDPAAAAKLLQDKSAANDRGDVFGQVFREYGQRDPEAAINMAKSMASPAARSQAIAGAINGWTEIDPAAAANFAVALPPGIDRDQALVRIGSAWAGSDPKAVLEWLKKAPPDTPDQVLSPFIRSLSPAGSPEMFADYLAAAGNQGVSVQIQTMEDRLYATTLAKSDLDAALAWAKQLPDGKGRDAALDGIVGVWAASDPKAAADFAAALPPGTARNRMLDNVLGSWSMRDPNAAADAASTLPADALQSSLVSRVFNSLTSQDPEAAAQLAASLPDGAARTSAIDNIARNWASSDPKRAADWLASLPEGEARANALGNVLESWASKSPDEAAKYAMTLTGQEQTTGVRSLVTGLVNSDPHFAADWVAKLPSGALRSGAEESLVAAWASADPEGAAAWLSSSAPGDNRNDLVLQFAEAAAREEPSLAWKWAMNIDDAGKQASALQMIAPQWLESDPTDARAAIQSSGLSADVISQLLNGGK